MDHASFHEGARVKALLEQAGLRLCYLLAYSPDLNPIFYHIIQQPTSTPLPYQRALQQASYYIAQIEKRLQNDSHNSSQQLLHEQIEIWQQIIHFMTQTFISLEEKTFVEAKLQQLPIMINRLQSQLAVETDPHLQADLRQMLQHYQQQQTTLKQLQISQKRARLQIDRAVIVLQTIYSQLLACQSNFQATDYQLLVDEVTEEFHQLQDYLEALQEVKLQS